MGKILRNLDAWFAGAMFAVTLSIVVINVFSRYFFSYMIPWGEEVATTCFVYTTFVGAAWCLRTRRHVGVDLLVEKLPGIPKKVLLVITDLIILATNAYITYLSVIYLLSSKVKTMPILKISSVWLNGALVAGFGLMALYSLAGLCRNLRPEKNEEAGI